MNIKGLVSGRKEGTQMDWRKFLQQMAAQMLGSVTGVLLVQLKQFAIQFRKDARQTPNPWDDILADFMCGMLGIPPIDE